MTDNQTNVIDARVQEALEQYFNGVKLEKVVGDCTLLSAIRKQNSAPVDVYTPTYAVSRDDDVRAAIARDFAKMEKLANPQIQSTERLLVRGDFRKAPALALLSCPVPVFDDAFDTRPQDYKIRVFEEVLRGLATLHSVEILHGNVHAGAVRREDEAAGLKLCDFAWSGGRTTTVTAQPVAYQSAHVVNASQPGMADDIYAAGMLGYRAFLGTHGPERVLTGVAEPLDHDQLVSAVLGEVREAPTGEDLFPEGHAAADQIARLLARMTGRLSGSAPYSTAEAALRALRSILDNPNVTVAEEAAAPPPPPPPQASAKPVAQAAAAAAPGGVSRNTALALFAGFVLAIGAAVWFFLQAQNASRDATALLAQNRSYEERLSRANSAFDAVTGFVGPLRSAERSIGTAEALGAAEASGEAATALATAEAALTEAAARFEARDYETVAPQATAAADAATSAVRLATSAADKAAEAVAKASAAVADTEAASAASAAAAERFAAARIHAAEAGAALQDRRYAAATEAALAADEAAAEIVDLAAAMEQEAAGAEAPTRAAQDAARTAGAAGGEALITGETRAALAAVFAGEGRHERARDAWAEAEAAFGDAVAAAESAAGAARAVAIEARGAAAEAVGEDALAEGDGRLASGDARAEEGRFTAAVEDFDAAAQLFATAVPVVPPADTAPRAVVVGSTAEEMSAAVLLCQQGAPAGTACPSARPGHEAAREATLAPFALDPTEVSAADFALFVGETGHVTDAERSGRVMAITSNAGSRFLDAGYTWSTPRGTNTTYETNPGLPVINVSMRDAEAYCQWTGGRLPTEAEWEYAAKAEAGGPFPWGAWDAEAPVWRGAPGAGRRLPLAVTAAGGASPDGLVALAGNAREWVKTAEGGALKGGSWQTTDPADLRVAARLPVPIDTAGTDFGFRCARDLEAWR